MTLPSNIIAEAIDQFPYNRGVVGADWLASEGNIPISFDNGDIALFQHEGDRDYAAHFLFVSRGRKAIEHVKESFRRMFTLHGAELIFGLVPDFNRKMKLVARWAGAKSAGFRSTAEGPCDLFVISSAMWKGE